MSAEDEQIRKSLLCLRTSKRNKVKMSLIKIINEGILTINMWIHNLTQPADAHLLFNPFMLYVANLQRTIYSRI